MKLRKCVSDNLDYLHGAELGLLGQAEVGDGAGGGGPVCWLHPYGGTIITSPNLAESAGRG